MNAAVSSKLFSSDVQSSIAKPLARAAATSASAPRCSD
jgi:hypothetical protein